MAIRQVLRFGQKKFVPACDFCGKTLPEQESYKAAVTAKAGAGWDFWKVEDSWRRDVCVECQTETPVDRERRLRKKRDFELIKTEKPDMTEKITRFIELFYELKEAGYSIYDYGMQTVHIEEMFTDPENGELFCGLADDDEDF